MSEVAAERCVSHLTFSRSFPTRDDLLLPQLPPTRSCFLFSPAKMPTDWCGRFERKPGRMSRTDVVTGWSALRR